MKLTDSKLKTLKPKDKRYRVFPDGHPGLYLLVGKTISFQFRYQLKGQRRDIKIGSYPARTLHDLLADYAALANKVSQEIDPLLAREQTAENNPLFSEFAERFISQHCKKKLKPATAGEYERQIRRDLIPAWGKRYLADIKRQQVAGLIESKSDTAPIMANRTLATIKKMFSYALEVGLIKENPASLLKPPAKEKGGDGRILTIPEIKSLFETVSGDLGDFLKLVTLTALRPGEVAGLRLNHIRTAVDGLWIELSGAETKNGKPTRIFLNPMAERIIKSRTVEDFLFPAKTKSGHTLLTTFESRLRKIRPQLSMESFTPHDLRRSAATGLSKLGYTGLVPNILNHSPKGITRQLYDLYDLAKEIKEAMTAWGKEIEKGLIPVREVQKNVF